MTHDSVMVENQTQTFEGIRMPGLFLRRGGSAAVFAVLSIVLTAGARAQNSPGPKPAPMPPPIAAPADTQYFGTISLLVDFTNVTDRVMQVHETIPIKGREITLLYPQWLPGNHAPSNQVAAIAGLVVTVDGKNIPWMRDPVDMYAFHVGLPQGATMLDVTFQYLAPMDPKQSRISAKFADLTWNSVVLYPAGYFTRDIKIDTALRLPQGWKFACALEVKSQSDSQVQFKQTDRKYPCRLAALCRSLFQAFRSLDWTGQPGIPGCLRGETWGSGNLSARAAVSEEPGDRRAETL